MSQQGLRESRVHSGHRLVQHHHVRLRHQRARHLEQLALAPRERPGELVAHVGQQEAIEQRIRAPGVLPLLRLPGLHQCGQEVLACLVLSAEEHVVDHRQPRQRLGQLEGAHHAHAGHFVRAQRAGRPAPQPEPRRAADHPPAPEGYGAPVGRWIQHQPGQGRDAHPQGAGSAESTGMLVQPASVAPDRHHRQGQDRSYDVQHQQPAALGVLGSGDHERAEAEGDGATEQPDRPPRDR